MMYLLLKKYCFITLSWIMSLSNGFMKGAEGYTGVSGCSTNVLGPITSFGRKCVLDSSTSALYLNISRNDQSRGIGPTRIKVIWCTSKWSTLNHFQMFSSITMTACSTTLAMGLMPLCLYGYTHVWEVTTHIKIPYSNMGTADSLNAHWRVLLLLEVSNVPVCVLCTVC